MLDEIICRSTEVVDRVYYTIFRSCFNSSGFIKTGNWKWNANIEVGKLFYFFRCRNWFSHIFYSCGRGLPISWPCGLDHQISSAYRLSSLYQYFHEFQCFHVSQRSRLDTHKNQCLRNADRLTNGVCL